MLQFIFGSEFTMERRKLSAFVVLTGDVQAEVTPPDRVPDATGSPHPTRVRSGSGTGCLGDDLTGLQQRW